MSVNISVKTDGVMQPHFASFVWSFVFILAYQITPEADDKRGENDRV